MTNKIIIIAIVLVLVLLSGCVEDSKRHEEREQIVPNLCSNYTNRTLIDNYAIVGRIDDIKTETIGHTLSPDDEYTTVYFEDGYVISKIETYGGWNYRKGGLYAIIMSYRLQECPIKD